MVAERFDTQPSADGPTPKQARFAAEASIRASFSPDNPRNKDSKSRATGSETETRKNKKKKRNRKRGRERSVIKELKPAAATEHDRADEGALDLGTLHEGEIDMRDGAVHTTAVIDRGVEAENARPPAIQYETVPRFQHEARSDEHNAPPVPPGFQEFSEILSVSNRTSAQRTPEQYQPPMLEATPLHRYPIEEVSRTTVTPVSVATRQLAEARPSRMPEAGQIPIIVEKPVSEMGRSELVKIAKNIDVDGVKLKDVFDARRIDQEGLRAVVETYLRGGDVKRQLTEEVIAKEQSFERDPLLRHQRQRPGGKLSAVAVSAATIATAGARGFIQEHGPQLAASSQKTAKKASRILANGAKHAHHDIIDNSNTADWLGITAIVIVWALIVFLIFG